MTLYQALEAQGKQQEAKEVLNDALKLGGKSGELSLGVQERFQIALN